MAKVGSVEREALLIIKILEHIPRNSWISTQDLQQSLNESGFPLETRRIQRLLKSIAGCPELGVECRDKGKPYGYRRSLPDSNLSQKNLRPQESLLVRLAEEYLKNQIPAPVMKPLQSLFELARESLKESGSTARQKAWLQKVAFVPDSIALMPPRILPRIFDAVSEALYRDSKLDLKYTNAEGLEKEHTVSPLGLIQQDQRLYLICKFDGYDNVRHLALHRMKTAKVLDFPSERPKNFALKDYINARHVNYSNGGKVLFVVEFESPKTKLILEETPFNRTQELIETADGKWRLQAVMDDTVLLDGWVASWKTEAKITRAEKRPLEGDGPVISLLRQ